MFASRLHSRLQPTFAGARRVPGSAAAAKESEPMSSGSLPSRLSLPLVEYPPCNFVPNPATLPRWEQTSEQRGCEVRRRSFADRPYGPDAAAQIGRASCRERVEISVVAV